MEKWKLLMFFKRKGKICKQSYFHKGSYKEEHQFITHDGSWEMILTQSQAKIYLYKQKMSCIINLICLKNSTLQTIKQEWVVSNFLFF